MTSALFDTNVILDSLLDRNPWNTDANALWQAHLDGKFVAYITATSLTDIFYIGRRHADIDKAWQAVKICLDQLYVISIGIDELQNATTLDGNDFEDNLQIASAISTQLDVIITRDPSGFAGSPIPTVTPAQMILKLGLSAE